MSENLRIGVPSKGRLADISTQLLKEAGLRFRRQDRSLFARVKEMPIDITFLRTDDIPVLCAEGAIDLGITGGDLVAESGVAESGVAESGAAKRAVAESELELTTRLSLGVGNCRLAVCVPESGDIRQPSDLAGRRIATSFPHVTQVYLAKFGATAHTVKLTGSVEVMITLGVADAIVDLVETGSTLAANRLRVLDEIGSYETVIVQNPKTPHSALADRIVRRVEGVVIARAYSLLEYNVPSEKLAAAEKITPGFNSPTVSRLENEDWHSVRAMVKRGEIIEIMEQLESLGATAILETPIANCRL